MLDRIFQPVVDRSPITVMAAAALARLLSAQRLDALFEKSRQGQYVHHLLFSTVFDLMAAVVAGTRKSVHHDYQTATEHVGVSVVAVYEKLRGIKVGTSRALVRDVFRSEADLSPDTQGGVLKVCVHPMANPRSNRAIQHLLDQLNAAEFTYPGTDLKLVYTLVGAPSG